MDAEYVYVLADNQGNGKAWARQNKPRQVARVFSTASEIGPRGLHLPDVPVFVLNEIPQHVREQWQMTHCNLVYV